jgi:hypothetical protein
MANIKVSLTVCGTEDVYGYQIDESLVEDGKIYQLPDGRCVSVATGRTETDLKPISFAYGPFDDCTECEQPFSSSTIDNGSEICVLDCNNDLVVLQYPVPIYTNNQNKAVAQLNAVVIGGNGMNN